ncbi:MAG TPA: DinB family protein [Chloroflexota bacterium]|nr:DinB family protein [Chloroflexota bacterium]
MEPPRTVAEVLERVHTTWAALHEAVAGLSDQQLTQPGPEGWSVKDHLAHIMVWDSVPIAVLRGEPQHRAFGLERDAYDRIDSVDQLNAIIYERFKGVPLAEVRTGLDSVHGELVAAIERLSDADLDRTIGDYGGDADDRRPLREKLEGDSYGHYAEHSGWLRDLRDALTASS